MSENQETLRVNYINLQNSFSQMMKQYKELESKIADRDLEIIKLKNILNLKNRLEIEAKNNDQTKN